MTPNRRVVFDCNIFLQALAAPDGPAGRCVKLALAANARLIVSRDRDLLDLMDPSKPEAAEFQNRFPSLRILGPVEFLGEIA